MSLRHRVALSVLFATSLLTASCGKEANGRKPTFPYSGKVTVQGKSAEHALVIFHPVSATDASVPKPRGQVSADGTFQLTTYETNDGAPEGDYKVTIEWWLADTKSPDNPATNRLPTKFSNPEQSGLTANVKAGPNEPKAFELKR